MSSPCFTKIETCQADTVRVCHLCGVRMSFLSPSGLSNELWAFDTKVSNWSFVSQAGPGLRAYHVAAWDPRNQAIWIHGGLGGSTGVAQGELWRFNILSHSCLLCGSRDFLIFPMLNPLLGKMSVFFQGSPEGSRSGLDP